MSVAYIQDSLHFSYNKVDNRHRRAYGAEVRISFQVGGLVWGDPMLRHLLRTFKDVLGTKFDSHRNAGEQTFWGTFWFPANKPSQINSRDECLRLYLSDTEDKIKLAVDRAVRSLEQEQRIECQVRLANGIGKHLAEEIIEKAGSIVRFRQRLAALHAEFKAEVGIQADAKLQEEQPVTLSADTQVAWGVTDADIEVSIQAALRNLSQYVDREIAGVVVGSGLFRAGDVCLDAEALGLGTN